MGGSSSTSEDLLRICMRPRPYSPTIPMKTKTEVNNIPLSLCPRLARLWVLYPNATSSRGRSSAEELKLNFPCVGESSSITTTTTAAAITNLLFHDFWTSVLETKIFCHSPAFTHNPPHEAAAPSSGTSTAPGATTGTSTETQVLCHRDGTGSGSIKCQNMEAVVAQTVPAETGPTTSALTTTTAAPPATTAIPPSTNSSSSSTAAPASRTQKVVAAFETLELLPAHITTG